MALPGDIRDREYAKFVETITGTAVRVEATVVGSGLPAGASTEAKQDVGNTSLASIDSKLSNLENLVDDLEGFTDGLEGLATTLNATATAIANSTDGLEGFTDQIESKLDTVNSNLTDLKTNTDQIESKIDQTNTTLSTGIASMLDRSASGSIVSPDTTTVIGPIACNGMATAKLFLSGTWFGSIVVEVSTVAAPGATDWTSLRVYNDTTAIGQNPIITSGQFAVGLAGATFVRVRRSNAGSGTAVISLNVSAAPGAMKVVSPNFNDFSVNAVQGAPGALANAWYTRITDATNGPVAVKAASVAPLATDPALVVAISPNGAQSTAALQTTGNASLASIDGKVATETTLQAVLAAVDSLESFTDGIDGKLDTLNAKDFATATKQDAQTAQLTAINANTDAIETKLDTLNAKDFATSAKQDLMNASLDALETQLPATLGPKIASASLSVIQSKDQTYSCTFSQFTAGATPTDVFVLTGSATKTIKILRITLSGTQTTESIREVILLKRSTLNTGGTVTSPTIVPMDSTNNAATAVANGYTANAAVLGTLIGNLYCHRLYIPETTKVTALEMFKYPHNELGQPITLRGANQMIALNLGGVTSPGNLLCCTITWSEE